MEGMPLDQVKAIKDVIAAKTGVDIPLPEGALAAGGGAPIREGEA